MTAKSAPRPRPSRRIAAVALALAALALLPYLAAGPGGFVNLDDGSYVLENPAVRGGLTPAGVRWALTAFHSSNWHPLTWLSHMLDVSLFGLDPRGHHLTSVLLHALSTALLFAALARMTGAVGRSAFAAALFGIHPLHVESVAWVSERKDVLSGLLFMLLLLTYERYARRGGAGRRLAVVGLFALGLAAKPMLVTAPLLLLLLDYWPLGRLGPGRGGAGGAGLPAGLLVEKLPLFLLAAASGAVTLSAQAAGGALRNLQVITPELRVANALVSYATYLGKAIWPSGLAVFYPYPVSGVPWARLAGSVILVAAASLAVVRVRRSRPSLAVGWCWYLVALLPVIGLVQVGEQAMADRYTYLPLVGPFLAAVWLGEHLARSRGAAAARGLAVAGAGVVLLGAGLSARQAGYWRDSETLYRRALAVRGDNWLAHNNLALFLAQQGRHREAIGHWEEAIRIVPDLRSEARNNIGKALFELGRPEEAVASYRASLRLRGDFAEAHYNLGLALASLGRQAEAEAAYREAIRFRPDFPAARTGLGRLLGSLGRAAEAEAGYREAIRSDPAFAEAHTNLGVLLVRGGRLREAEASFREAARLRPDLAEPWINLGYALLSQGRHAEAGTAYREALRRAPGSYPALAGLGRVLAAQGLREEAAARFREALRVNPGAEQTRRDLEALGPR